MKKIFSWLAIWKFWIFVTNVFSKYYSNGIYWIKDGKTLTKKSCFRPLIVVFNFRRKIKTISNSVVLQFQSTWQKKIVIYKEPFIFSYYKDKGSALTFLSSIQKYIGEMLYNYPKFIDINIKKKYSVTSFIKPDTGLMREELATKTALYILQKNALSTKYYNYQYENNRAKLFSR